MVSLKQSINWHNSAQNIVLFDTFEVQAGADDASKEAG